MVAKAAILSVFVVTSLESMPLSLNNETVNINKNIYSTSYNIGYTNTKGMHSSIYNVVPVQDKEDGVNVSFSVPLTRNLDKLRKISKLELKEDNSISFSKYFIQQVANILGRLKYQPEIFPTFTGNIQLEYETDNQYLEIEVTPTNLMKIFSIKSNGEENEGEFVSLDLELIKQEVEAFYEQDWFLFERKII